MNSTFIHQQFIRVLICLGAISGIAAAQPSIAVLSGTESGTAFYSTSNLAPVFSVSGLPAGSYQFLPEPDGSKYYVVAGAPGLTKLDRNLSNPVQVLGNLGSSPRSVTMSPDGRRLFAIADNRAYFIDTGTDSVIGSSVNLTGNPVDVAFSHDGQTAFVLSDGSFTAFVMRVDLSGNAIPASISLPISGSPTGIAVAPSGLVYVSAPNAVFEINPRTMAVTPGPNPLSAATIPVNGTPGKLQFTSDSAIGVALNLTPASGPVILFYLNAGVAQPSRSASLRGTLDQLFVPSSSRIFAHSTENVLYEFNPYGGLDVSPAVSGLPADARVISLVPSNESDAASLFLIAVLGGSASLYKIDLATNAVLARVPLSDAGASQVLVFASPNPSTGGLYMDGIGTAQNIAPGATSLPLVARVLDINGVPVYNSAVTFTSLCPGITLSSNRAVTNAMGLAEVYATAGTSPGIYRVQASIPGGAGGGVAYTVSIPGAAVAGGCFDANTDSISIAGGNGQIVSAQQVSQQLMMVAVKDADGRPIANQQVTFAVVQGSGTLLCPTIGDLFPYLPTGSCGRTVFEGIAVMTDATGRAGVKFLSTSVDQGQSFTQAVVNASTNQGFVNFVMTTVAVARANGNLASLPEVDLVSPQPESTPPFTGVSVIRGSTGQTIPGALRFRIAPADGQQQGMPLAGVAVNVSGSGDPKTTPSATCAGGSALSDATGLASCDLVLGPVAGTAPLVVNIGGAIYYSTFAVVVTPGAPFNIRVLQGDNQSGTPGQALVLRAQILEASGNAAPNVPVTWSILQGTGTLSASSQQSETRFGDVQSTLTLGLKPGPVVVALTAGSGSTATQARFSININPPLGTGAGLVASLTAVSGGGQVTAPGQSFASPLMVQVSDASGQPVAGLAVSFNVASGSATLGSPAAITDARGNAGTTVTAGAGGGPILVTASAGNLSTQFSLTSRGPSIAIDAGAFRNAASNVSGLAPCAVATVSGTGLATGIVGTVQSNAPDGTLPLSFAGVSLTVNGIRAPILALSNNGQGSESATFQTPCEAASGAATIVVSVNAASTTISNVPVSALQPGIFEVAYDGRRQAALTRSADGISIGPGNPAHPGDRLEMFVTGIGQTAPPIITGRPGTGGQTLNRQVTVLVNNTVVPVITTEYLAGTVGVYSITFDLPAGLTGPYQTLSLSVTDPSDPAAAPVAAQDSAIPIG